MITNDTRWEELETTGAADTNSSHRLTTLAMNGVYNGARLDRQGGNPGLERNRHDVMDFLQQLESTRFSQWVTQSNSIFSFPSILLFHTYGMGILVGIVAGMDLRILGFAPALPLAPMKKLFPIVWVAFWINAITGTMLLIADATTKVANPDFAIKMIFVLLGVVNLRILQKRVFREPDITQGVLPANAKLLAVTSLVCWLGAITAGRLLAYVGPVTGLQ